MFLAKNEAIMFLPGSRRGFHSFLNSGRSKRLMGDAILFKTARSDGEHLGPGSYDLPSTLTTGRRPGTTPEFAAPAMPLVPQSRSRSRRVECSRRLGGSSSIREGKARASSSPSSAANFSYQKGTEDTKDTRLLRNVYLEEERAEDVRAVRALPNISVTG
eukprot:g7502.t1